MGYVNGLRGRLAAAMLAGCLIGAPLGLAAGEAGDLIFAERGPWALGDRTVIWTETQEGPVLPSFRQIRGGRLVLSEVMDARDGQPVLQLEQTVDDRSRKIGPFPVSAGDPVVVFFLENTARDMATLTGGSPYYIRNRIKDAVFRGGSVQREGGVTTVVTRPFEGDPNAAHMGGFAGLELRFVMDEDARQPIREMVAETTDPVAVATPREMAGQVIAPAPYRHALVMQ